VTKYSALSPESGRAEAERVAAAWHAQVEIHRLGALHRAVVGDWHGEAGGERAVEEVGVA
jgi:hypothetical protein